PETFSPVHPLLREMALRHRGVRVGRSCRGLEALVPAILEQKVVGLEALRAWRLLLTRFGGPAPGPAPAGVRVFPPPAVWTAIPSWEWRRAGVEGVRARTVAAAARLGGRLEEILELAAGPAHRPPRSPPGVGPRPAPGGRRGAGGGRRAAGAGGRGLPAPLPAPRSGSPGWGGRGGPRPPRHGHRMP